MNKKILCLLLTVIILSVSLFVPAHAAQLPQGVTESDIAEAAGKADKVIEGLMSSGVIDLDVKRELYGMLISDGTLNSVFTALYSALGENEDTFKIIGADISVGNVASCLAAYPEVSAYLSSKQTWQEVFASPMECKWGLEEKDGFAAALSDMLSPFNELLYVILCSGKAGGIVSVQGADGYQNAVVPLLEAAGCPVIMSQADYTAQAGSDRRSMIKNAVSMFFAAIDNLLEKPVENSCKYLPRIADYLDNGGIAESANALISPIVVRIGIIPLSGLDRLIGKSGVFSDPEGLSNMFEGFDAGSAAGIALPEIDLSALAACTEKTDSGYQTDEAQAFVTIMNFLIDTLKLNADSPDMPEEAADILKAFTEKSSDDIIRGIVSLLCAGPGDCVQDYQWQYPAYTPGSVTYPKDMTRENFERVLTMLDSTLSEFLVEFAGQEKLSKTVAGAIYSEDTLTALTKGLYSTLSSEEISAVTSLMGADFSVYAAADAVESDFPSAAASLRYAGSWEDVDYISWDIKTGKRKGFEKALNDILEPFSDIFNMLLSEGSLTVFNAITLYGSDGYNTAIIPVLEALGCSGNSIKTYSEYKNLPDKKKISCITSPVFDLLDSVIKEPIKTLCGLLPNIIYFIDSGCLSTVIENLLYPVTNLLEKAGLSDMLPSEMTDMKIDLGEITSGITDSADLGFELPQPDMKKLMSLGTPSVLTSKSTFSGAPATYTYITADAPAVLVTAVRYVFEAMGKSDTDLFSGMMGGSEGADANMFSMYSSGITKELSNKSTDELIKWFYDLLFAETPKREEVTVNDFIPTVIYQPEKDYTGIVVKVAAILLVAAATGAVIFISKHDFSKEKPKKTKKKKRGKAEKEVTA